jgi:hypothetical protein
METEIYIVLFATGYTSDAHADVFSKEEDARKLFDSYKAEVIRKLNKEMDEDVQEMTENERMKNDIYIDKDEITHDNGEVYECMSIVKTVIQ